MRVLSVEQLARRLDDHFRLLTGGSRTVQPRQQTLRALIDGSYDLLSEPERALLWRLSLFAGSRSLEAAEAVGAGEPVPADAVLDLLTALVDKSLVLTELQAGETRYRLLETVRQYGRHRLIEAGEAAALRERFLRYAVALAEEAVAHLRGPEQAAWLARLDLEHDNLRAALDAEAATAVEPELELRLLAALWWYWFLRGQLGEARARLEAGLRRATADTPNPSQVEVALGAGVVAGLQNDVSRGLAHLQAAEAAARRLGDDRRLGRALGYQGMVTQMCGGTLAAEPLLEAGAARCRQCGDRWGEAVALNELGFTRYRRGQVVSAQRALETALNRFRHVGDPWGISQVRSYLGLLAPGSRDYVEARTQLEAALGFCRSTGKVFTYFHILLSLGDVARSEGDYERAARIYEECDAHCSKHGISIGLGSVRHNQGYVALAQRDPGTAARCFADGLERFTGGDDARGVADCLIGLGGVAVAAGEVELGARLVAAGEGLLEALGTGVAPTNVVDHGRIVAQAQAHLGAARYAEAEAVGRALPRDRALALGRALAARVAAW